MSEARGTMKVAETKHEAVRQHLVKRISRMKPHQPLPTERELAAEFAVSRMTLRQALGSLAAEGLVYAVRGSGTYVSGSRLSKEVLLSSFSEDMIRRGLQPSSRVLMAQVVVPSRDIATVLDLDEGESAYHIERLRLADGVPICLEKVHLPASAVPGLLERDLQASLYEILRSRYERPVTTVQTVVRAGLLNKRESGLLGVSPRSPGLFFTRFGFDHRSRPLEHCVSVFRGDRFDLRYTVYL